MSMLKRLLIGRPLATREAPHQRLSKRVALAIFSADAIASSAFATQEILHVLVPVAALGALDALLPISAVVVVLLVIVVASYRQTIRAYPGGGGSYIVSRENLGEIPALFAGGSLLVDYTLTVAVSIAAGVAAVTSAIPALRGDRVLLCVVFTVLLALVNLRGVKESGRLFAAPTYGYILLLGALIVTGLVRSYSGDLAPLPVDQEALAGVTEGGALLGATTAFLLLRAFSSGAVALSGVEAISNGVPAFKPPESRNAAITLTWTGTILAILFSGVALLTVRLAPTLSEDETILSIMGRAVFGGGPLYALLQAATAAILILSANTAFADFPRLSAIIAADGYLPRQLSTRGDRLVFSNGILLLAAASVALLVGFGGVTTLLIPLFAVGLFASFTLSQSGMVVHHLRERESGWQLKAAVNGLGAVTTLVVLVVVILSKFTSGAWIPTLVIPLMVLLFRGIHGHYRRTVELLDVRPGTRVAPIDNTVIVLVGTINRGTVEALAYAESLRPARLFAVSVAADEEATEQLRARWEEFGFRVPLEVLESPFRDITDPVMAHIERVDAEWTDDVITVVIPEFVVGRWWEQALHNQTALALKGRLLFRPNTVVTSFPMHLEGDRLLEDEHRADDARRKVADRTPVPPVGPA